MTFIVRSFAAADTSAWDDLVSRSCNGTFIHTQRYLSYHGDRFVDASLVVSRPDGRLVAVLPAAAGADDPALVVSHPGITYGGLVHDGTLRGAELLQVLEQALAEYRGRGYTRLQYKPVPYIYHRVPAGDDLYAMFRLGATRSCNLSAAIDLQSGSGDNRSRRKNRATAERAGVRVVSDERLLTPLWEIVEAFLMDRHGARPVHTLAEMRLLMDAFPENIECLGVLRGDDLIGGLVIYKTPRVVRPQYGAETLPEGRELFALDVGHAAALETARQAGTHYYELGHSNEDDGRVLNASLYAHKMYFGAGGVPFETYEIDLSR